MREACEKNIRMKAVGTQYSFGHVGFTDGWLIDMSYLRHPTLDKQLQFEYDNQLLDSNVLAQLKIKRNELIICEAGTTIEMIHDVTWPQDKKTGRRWSVFKDEDSTKKPKKAKKPHKLKFRFGRHDDSRSKSVTFKKNKNNNNNNKRSSASQINNNKNKNQNTKNNKNSNNYNTTESRGIINTGNSNEIRKTNTFDSPSFHAREQRDIITTQPRIRGSSANSRTVSHSPSRDRKYSTNSKKYNYNYKNHKNKNISSDRDRRTGRKREKYKMLENIAGWDKLSIGGLINVGAQGFGNKIPLVQNNVLSFRLLTVVKTKKDGKNILKEYQIERSIKNGGNIHNKRKWEQHYGKTVELIQDDDIFRSAIVSAGTFGIVYSYHLKLIDAMIVKQQKIYTSWKRFKKMFPILQKYYENDIVYRYEIYVSPYKGLLLNGIPVVLIVEYKVGDNEKQTKKINSTTGGVTYGKQWIPYLTGATLVWATHYLPQALGLFNELAFRETAHGGLIMDALKAFKLGSPIAVPAQATGVGVRNEHFMKAVETWLYIFNDDLGLGDDEEEKQNLQKMKLNMKLKPKGNETNSDKKEKEKDKYVAATGIGVTWSLKAKDGGYISMSHEKHNGCWIEWVSPDYTYDDNFLINKVLSIGSAKGWSKSKNKFFDELMKKPFYGKCHLGLQYRIDKNIWQNKQYYPYFNKFLKQYTRFNQSKLFSNQFTKETQLDYLAFGDENKEMDNSNH